METNPYAIRPAHPAYGPEHCVVPLACGHDSRPMNVGSASFDHPEDPVFCPTCGDLRQFNVHLQVQLALG